MAATATATAAAAAAAAAAVPVRRRQHFPWRLGLGLLAVIAALGGALSWISSDSGARLAEPAAAKGAQRPPSFSTLSDAARSGPPSAPEAAVVSPEPAADQRSGRRGDFERGSELLRQAQYGKALAPLRRAIELEPSLAEAHANLGFALLGAGEPAAARQAFQRAVDLRPDLANAYYGIGATSDQLGDPEMALGAMRSFLHLTREKNPYDKKVVQVRSAIWEIEAGMGRGPWGASNGIPPGLTADDVKKDDLGPGMVMLLPDGTARSQERPASHRQSAR